MNRWGIEKIPALSVYVTLTLVTGLVTADRSGRVGGLLAVLAGGLIWVVLIWATWKGSKAAWGALVLGACIGMFNHWVFATDGEDVGAVIVPIALGVGQVVFLILFRWRVGKE